MLIWNKEHQSSLKSLMKRADLRMGNNPASPSGKEYIFWGGLVSMDLYDASNGYTHYGSKSNLPIAFISLDDPFYTTNPLEDEQAYYQDNCNRYRTYLCYCMHRFDDYSTDAVPWANHLMQLTCSIRKPNSDPNWQIDLLSFQTGTPGVIDSHPCYFHCGVESTKLFIDSYFWNGGSLRWGVYMRTAFLLKYYLNDDYYNGYSVKDPLCDLMISTERPDII